ncbi:FHF complex subunit HOOK interacting protein 2A-like [Clavelina lepadiformis]|uniref:FHF complex subunit HOOK-interacting protein C-terminal domain-containing protein n=1 Tax=Clavelina lepadiformis TaxID=159417 RepID=A0ABP0FTI8_CLALP
MFNKFTTILQQAVEALAPDAPLHEDFVYHWKSITNFYIENTDDKTPVTDSNIPSHLKQMLQILIQEEAEREPGDTGPCMEYMLQHKLLETLHTLGKADCPPGMKQQVLIFFKNLLGKIKQPLLPHINVHRPVSRLVRVCGEVQAAPTETEEISFLCTLCARLKREPHLLHFFLQNNSTEIPNKPAASTNHIDSSETNLPSSSAKTSKRESYDLVDSLLNLCRSEDGRVAVKACEGLLLLVSMPHETAARATVQDTMLCPLLNTRLRTLFTSLPAALDPSDVDSVSAKWGLDSHSYAYNDARNFAGKRSLVSFLSWFDYCDQLIMEAYQDCSAYIARSIAKDFLNKTLLGPLLQADERAALTTTAVLTKLFSMVRSHALTCELVNFIVPNNTNLPEEGKETLWDTKKSELLSRLLERCDHFSDEISIVTLRLFETVLGLSNSIALDRLILKHLQHRAYHVKNPGNIVVQSDSEELEWDLEPGLDSAAPQTPPKPNKQFSTESLDGAGDASSSRAHIQRAVSCFLAAIPDSAKSTQANDDESGYDGYLREAHRMYKDVCAICCKFSWPKMNGKELEAAERCQPVAVYEEGPFLTMLLNKLSRVLSQPYGVNLVVTSIISRLCLIPHPLLHELFTDPLTPMRPKARGVYSVIKVIVEQISHRMAHVPNFKNRLLLARRKLASGGGFHDDDHNVSPTHKGLPMAANFGASAGVIASNDLDDHKTFLEGTIVVEEFCKELAAIVFVKHHALAAQSV